MVDGSAVTTVRPPVGVQPVGVWQRRRDRRREQQRLAEHDRRVARQAELHLLGELLGDASALVEDGWVQHCWFTVRDERGERRRVGPRNLQELDGRAIDQVCLVGAIVQAAGGVARAGSQPVHRALDLTWATLYHLPVRWCPAPSVRLAHIHDLTRWNDADLRSTGDVVGLLSAAACRATVETA